MSVSIEINKEIKNKMKNIPTFEEFLNESIELVSMQDDGVSNSNKSSITKKHKKIEDVLLDPDSWTDDISFKDKLGNVYFIDDLIDKTIKIGSKTITVIEEDINESSPDSRIEDLAKDPKTHKSLGVSDVEKLKYAFTQLFRRGYGAAKTNWAAVNPNIKKLGRTAALSAWGYARMNAFIQKTKGYETTDSDLADWLNGKGEKPKEKS